MYHASQNNRVTETHIAGRKCEFIFFLIQEYQIKNEMTKTNESYVFISISMTFFLRKDKLLWLLNFVCNKLFWRIHRRWTMRWAQFSNDAAAVNASASASNIINFLFHYVNVISRKSNEVILCCYAWSVIPRTKYTLYSAVR